MSVDESAEHAHLGPFWLFLADFEGVLGDFG